MLPRVANLFSAAKEKAVTVLTSKENVMIIQIHPKRRVLTVSYKGSVKTAKFADNAIKNMLKGGIEFENNSFQVLGAAARLIAEIVYYTPPSN